MKPRLDELLVARGLAPTKSKAQGMIMAGIVAVNGQSVTKAGKRIDPEAVIELIEPPMPYVGRGGVKLAAFLETAEIDPSGWVVADIGSSTGGFTDVLLKKGAAKVYAVDVGRGLLDWSLRNDPRVEVREGINARFVTREIIPEPLDAVVVDCSFISLRLLIPPLIPLLKPDGVIITLVKPQFEVGKGKVGKGGVVRDPDLIRETVTGIRNFAVDLGLIVTAEAPSTLLGTKGNREIFLLLQLPARDGRKKS